MTIKANEPSDFPRLRPELEASALELAGVGEPDVREIRTWMCAALLADATPHQLEDAAKLLDAVAAKDSRARDCRRGRGRRRAAARQARRGAGGRMTPLSDSGASVRRALLETLGKLNAGGSCGSGLVAGELAILTGCFGTELDAQLRVLEHEQVIESNSEPLFPGAARLTRYRLRAE